MKKIFGKVVLAAALAFGAFGAVGEIEQASAAEVTQQTTIPTQDQMGIKFANYKDFEAYKVQRDKYYAEDVEMAKEYWELMDVDIMPIINKEYESDLAKAKLYYEAVKNIPTETFGMKFKDYKNFSAFKTQRDKYYAEDLEMAKEYWELLDKDIKPILEQEYKRDMELATQYYTFHGLMQ